MTTIDDKRSPWLPRTKLTISLLILGFVLYLLTRFTVIIAPFVLACILAYVISPIANFMANRLRMWRGLAVAIIYVLLIAGIITVPAVGIPPLANQIAGLNVDIQRFLGEIAQLFGHQYVIAGQVIDGAAIFDQVVSLIQEILQPLFGQTLGFAFDIIESLIWIIFVLVVSFYLVKDSHNLKKWVERLPPPGYKKDFIRLRGEINAIWAAFFRGQLLLGSIVATIFTVIGLMIGLPSPLAMGLFAGLMEFIPTVGHGIWLFTASIIAYFAGSTWMQVPNWVFVLIIVGLHVVFQQFDLNYLIPRIIGRQVHLPPLVVILGIVAGATLAGVLGVALAAPTIASSRVVGRYIYANLFDMDPFQGITATPLPPPNPRWWIFKRKKKVDDEGDRGDEIDLT
jgi:predicted PurR-regulated permease PerM